MIVIAKDIEDVKPYAQEYLQNRLDNGCSVRTVKMERSALGMLYGETIKIEICQKEIPTILREVETIETPIMQGTVNIKRYKKVMNLEPFY